MGRIKFGTEGWRGIIADDFTFENVRRVSTAVALYLREKGFSQVAVAFDRRFLSDRFAKVSAQTLSEAGIDVALSDRSLPTPAASLYAYRNEMGGSVVITASHNPYFYNGFKFKPHYGGTATDDIVADIVKYIAPNNQSTLSKNSLQKGCIEERDMLNPHLEEIAGKVDRKAIEEAGKVMKGALIFDSMHGVTAGLFKKLIEEKLRVKELHVEEIRENEDPLFDRGAPEPIPKYMKPLQKAVVSKKVKLGLTSDGDGDRFAAVSEKGIVLTTHELFPLLLLHLIKHKTPEFKKLGLNKVVKTVSSPLYLDLIARDHSLKTITVPVGFKFITEQFLKGGVLIGGEESGGVGYHFYIPERDGLLSNLLLVEYIGMSGKTLQELLEELWRNYGKYLYSRRDLHLEKEFEKEELYEKLNSLNIEKINLGKDHYEVESIDTTDGVKFIFSRGKGWILFRASGTEPLVRVYSETLNGEYLEDVLDWGENIVKKLIQ